MTTFFMIRSFFILGFTFCNLILMGQVQDNIVDNQLQKVLKLEKLAPSYSKDTSLAIEYAYLARLFVDESNDSLLKYHKKAQELALKTNLKKALGLSEIALATHYRESGYYAESLKLYNNALEYFGESHQAEVAATFSHMGILYTYSNQYLRAIDCHKRSQEIYTKLKDVNGIVDNEANIGNAYLENGYAQKSLTYFKELEHIYNTEGKKINDLNGHKCVNYINLCTAYLRLGNYTKAKPFEDSALVYCEIINGISEKQYLLTELARYFINTKEYKRALAYTEELDKLIVKLNSDLKERDNLYLKYLIYKGDNQPDSALAFLEKFNLLDQKLNLDKAEAEVKYDSDAKQKEIDKLNLLTKKRMVIFLFMTFVLLIILLGYFILNNRKLRKKNKEISEAMLKGQVVERKRVASDLHDTLGSTLSSLRWSLEAIDTKKLSLNEQEIYEHVQNTLQKSYEHVRLLSHNLLPEELNKAGLWKTLEQFVKKLDKSTEVSFTLIKPDTPPELLPRIQFEIYSILLELTNNVLKHAKAKTVLIKFDVVDLNRLMFSLSDDGVGFDSKNKAGKGLKNIESRVDSLKGEWIIKKNNPVGTNHTFFIKLNHV